MSKFKEHVLALLREKVAVEHYADGPAPTLVGLEAAAEALYEMTIGSMIASMGDSGVTGIKMPEWMLKGAVRLSMESSIDELVAAVSKMSPATITVPVQFVEPAVVTPEEEQAILGSELIIDDAAAPVDMPVAEQTQVAVAEMPQTPVLQEPKWWEENDKKRKGMHAVATNMDGSTPMDCIDTEGDATAGADAGVDVSAAPDGGGVSEAAGVMERIEASAYLRFAYAQELLAADQDEAKARDAVMSKYMR